MLIHVQILQIRNVEIIKLKFQSISILILQQFKDYYSLPQVLLNMIDYRMDPQGTFVSVLALDMVQHELSC